MVFSRLSIVVVACLLLLIDGSFSNKLNPQRFLVKRSAHEGPDSGRGPPRGPEEGGQRHFDHIGSGYVHRFVRSPQDNNGPPEMNQQGPPGPPPPHHWGHHEPHGPPAIPPAEDKGE